MRVLQTFSVASQDAFLLRQRGIAVAAASVYFGDYFFGYNLSGV